MIRRTASWRASVYLPALRGMVPKSLDAFDPVSQNAGDRTRRDATTVPARRCFS
jgi:hypothetical protein